MMPKPLKSRFRRVALDAVFTFAITFAPFWFIVRRRVITSNLVVFAMIYAVGAIFSAFLFDRFMSQVYTKIISRLRSGAAPRTS